MEGLIEEGAGSLADTGEVPQIYIKPAGVCGIGKDCNGAGTGCQ